MVGIVQGTTPNYGFSLARYDAPGWDAVERRNWLLVDTLLRQVGASVPGNRGLWTNGTQYGIGDYVVDVTTNTIFLCLVAHTSAMSGTFAADRLSRPTLWQMAVSYNPGDLVSEAFVTASIAAAVSGLAPLNSPVFTGNPRVPTPGISDSVLSAANVKYVADSVLVVQNALTASNSTYSGILDKDKITASSTVSGSAVSVDMAVGAGFDMFEVFVSGVQVTTNNSNLNVQFSTDGGSTFINSGYTFQNVYGTGTAITANNGASQSVIPIAGALTNTAIGVATLHGILEPGSVFAYPSIAMTGRRNTISNIEAGTFTGYLSSTVRINAIRFIAASNLQRGNFILRGIKV